MKYFKIPPSLHLFPFYFAAERDAGSTHEMFPSLVSLFCENSARLPRAFMRHDVVLGL